MVRYIVLMLTCAACLISCRSSVAAEAKRLATVVDSAGVESEIADVKFSGSMSRFSGYYGSIAIQTGMFQIAVPMKNVAAIHLKDAKKKTFEVTYTWQGKERQVIGTLVSGEISGKGDFGDVKLSASSIKSLVFSKPPIKDDKKQTAALSKILKSNVATLTLHDDSEVPVSNLKRHDSYYSTEGYLIGGSTRYRHYTDFRFRRGESLLTVSFSKIKRIDFGEKGSATVTLKNGKSAAGVIVRDKQAGVDGFTGYNESGNFFISPSNVKSIAFRDAESGDDKK